MCEGLIELVGEKPAGPSSQARMHYQISAEGLLRLKEELHRLHHAVRIGEAAGLLREEVPTDIQRLLNNI